MGTISPTFDVGTTVFLELAFTDRYGVMAIPTAVTMQINDVTNGGIIYPATGQAAPAGSTLEIAIPATLNVMTRPVQTQTNTVVITATYPDGSITVDDFTYLLNNPSLLKTSYRP